MTKSFSASGWRFLKILGLSTAILLLFTVIGTLIIFRQKNGLLLDRIQSYMKESQSGTLEITNLDLRFFKQFPDLTLELDGVSYYEHHDSVRAQDELPIMHADQLFVAVGIWPLLHSEVNISQLSIEQAQFNIVEYADGRLNVDHALTKPSRLSYAPSTTAVKPVAPPPKRTAPPKKPSLPPAKPKTPLSIDLKLIQLTEVRFSWKAANRQKPSVVLIKDLEAGLSSNQNQLQVNIAMDSRVEQLFVAQSSFPSADVSFHGDFVFDKSSQHLTVRESTLHYGVFSATLHGSYAHRQGRLTDLTFDASSNDLPLLSLLLRPEILRNNRDLVKHGDIFVKGRIFGALEKSRPQLDLTFGVKNLGLNLPNNLGKFEKVGFEGMFSSGGASDYSEAQLEINNLRGKLPGGSISGRFHLRDFANPYVRYKLNGTLKLDGYDRVFKMDFLKDLGGSVSLRANFDGLVDFKDRHTMDSSRSSVINLNNISFVLTRSNKLVSGLSGTIETKNNLTTLNQVTFEYGKSDVLLNAAITNLLYRILGKETVSNISGNWKSDEISTHDFILDTLRTPSIQDRISHVSFDFSASTNQVRYPRGMAGIAFEVRNLSAKLDKLPDIKQFSAKGEFSQEPSGFNLNLHESHLIMPQGKLDVDGDLLIPPRNHLWKFNARAKMDRFPLDYVKELLAEIRPGVDPNAKLLPIASMELVTADLDLSATVNSNPSEVAKLEIRNSRVSILLPDSKPLSFDKLNLTQDLLPSNGRTWTFSTRVRMDKFPWPHVKELVTQIRVGIDPSARYIPSSPSELITADLDIASTMKSGPFAVDRLEVRNSRLNILLPDSKSYTVDKFSLTLNEFLFSLGEHSGEITGVKSIVGLAKVNRLKIPDFDSFDLALNMAGKDNQLDIGFSTNRLKAGDESGHLLLDISGKDPSYHLRYAVRDASLAAFMQKLRKGKLLEGKINYDVDMHTSGKTWTDIKENLEGAIAINGDSLTLYGMDIDNFLKKYEKSQKFNLTDLGAVLIAGPVGIVATKGSDFVALSVGNLDPSQHSSIQTLLAKWKFSHHQLKTEDVAFTTPVSRIAFDGSIDFQRDSIPGFTVAVVDKNGCSLMDQKIYGKINALKTGKLNVTKTIFGSVTNFVNAVAGKDCKPIYEGTVKHPGH